MDLKACENQYVKFSCVFCCYAIQIPPVSPHLLLFCPKMTLKAGWYSNNSNSKYSLENVL